MEEAIRISKILSELGLCSRREADNYIAQGLDRKSTRLNSSHSQQSRMPSSA